MEKRILSLGSRLLLLAAVLLVGIRCASDSTPDYPKTDPGSGSGSAPVADKELKEWMVDYMRKAYLWNEAMAQVTPDYTLEYERFLDRILLDIEAQDDVNHDDGHWENGRRLYFYTNVQRYDAAAGGESAASLTRGTRKTTEGSGITNIYCYYRDTTRESCVFIVGGVAPLSSAGKAGLRRGSVIEKVNDRTFGPDEVDDMFMQIVYPAGQVRVSLVGSADGGISYGSGSYEDNPVWATSVLDLPDGRKVGYLCYDSFNYHYDDDLLEAFSTIRDGGVDELVLDLRYNSGGHVVSSALLGTFVAGMPHKDEVYMRVSYNAQRTASGEPVSVYRIGNMNFGDGTYSKILSALDVSLGLDRVYVLCTEQTASASELVINGLRGLGIDVRLIGTKTNGKNVGMESITRTFDGYEYVFSPITFYSENGLGFRDYGDGFDPDVEVSEPEAVIRDWGDPEDAMMALALKWIETGVKPEIETRAAEVRRVPFAEFRMPRKSLEGMIVCRDFYDE